MEIALGFGSARNQSPSAGICRFYQRGICRFGSNCRFRHVGPQITQATRFDQRRTPNRCQLGKALHKQVSGLSLNSNSTPDTNAMNGTNPSASGSSTTASNEASAKKECGICFDIIIQKEVFRDRTFGILPNCNHCFCFTCIRKWRQTKEFDFDVSKACPECRKPSEYVYPSKVWFDNKESKDTFITKEKGRMQKINCRYFSQGSGKCPFGNTCLYLHAMPNGELRDVGPPKPRRRRASNIDSEMLHQILYWLTDEEDDDFEDVIADLDDDYEDDDDFDVEDQIAMAAFYGHDDDLDRFMTFNRLMNADGQDSDSEYDGYLI